MLQLFNSKKEYYLQIQPFKDKGIFIKRRGDRYIIVGNTRDIAARLIKKGYKFDTTIKAWLFPARKQEQYIYTKLAEDIGVQLDMRKYKHLIGTEKRRALRPMKADRSTVLNYRVSLQAILDKLKQQIEIKVIPILLKHDKQYGNTRQESFLKEALAAIEDIKKKYNFDKTSKQIALYVVNKCDKINKSRFALRIQEATGIDVAGKI